MSDSRPHIVIVGGGFGGLYAAKKLGSRPVRVTLIDKRNFHLFQPLLYQVATGGLSPGDITCPLRAVLRRHKNITVLQGEVTDLDTQKKRITLSDGELTYDTLILATGASHSYFGNDAWAPNAPGLKTVEDALDIRRRIFLAFEAAERESDPEIRRAWMTFVIVGAGPTGVELAGALCELAHSTLAEDFRNINTRQAQILLLEGAERVLQPYPPRLSESARKALEQLGATVHTNTIVTHVDNHRVRLRQNNTETEIPTRTVLWAAGTQASPLSRILARETGIEPTPRGQIPVEPDLTVPGYPDILVIGDLASFKHQDNRPLPGIAPVAMQMGRYAANLVLRRLKNKKTPPFHYLNKGTLAVIGRNAAVADLGIFKFSGFPAWLAWIFIHIAYLIEFDNKLLVLFQWAWNYFTRKRGARLITGANPFPLVGKTADGRRQTADEKGIQPS